jgi:hypothetical protein
MLISIDNLLDDNICDTLIEIFNTNKQITSNHLGSLFIVWN